MRITIRLFDMGNKHYGITEHICGKWYAYILTWYRTFEKEYTGVR